MATCNPFKVGDKVKLKKSSYEFDPIFWKKYGEYKYSVVVGVDGQQIFTTEDNSRQHYTHFEFYEDEKEMAQQSQQKTKRVPFTHELWEKWKDKGGKVIYSPTGGQVLQLAYFPEADHRYRYVYLTTPGTVTRMGTCDPLNLEIPVTTKRIPFNPELKDAKVFYGETELTEWFRAKTGVICGTHAVNNFDGEDTSLYHPNYLQMEIEEDV
jgi:hypothetical protein